MAPRISPQHLASLATRRPWTVIGVWMVVVVAAMALATTLGGVLTTEARNYVETESSKADAVLAQAFHGAEPPREVVVIQSADQTVDDPAFEHVVTTIVEGIRAIRGLSVVSYYESHSEELVSGDRRTTIIPVSIEEGGTEYQAMRIMMVLAPFDGRDGVTAVTAGPGSIASAFSETSERDLRNAEVIGLPVALLVLVVVFGALLAAGVPLALAVFSIIVALGIAALVGREFELSIFVVNIVSTLGLAVGIDYSLLVVQRVREERRNGLSRDGAIVKAGATAGRAVLFSGITVVVALSGLVIVPQSIFRSMGIGAIAVVVVAVLAALTLLPAILQLMGHRVDSLRIRMPLRSTQGDAWGRAVSAVMRRPLMSVALSSALLVAAALPYLTIELGWAGVSTLPPHSDARRAFEILNSDFSAGMTQPVEVVVLSDQLEDSRVTGSIEDLIQRIERDPAFGSVSLAMSMDRTVLVLSTTLRGDAQSDEARAAINRLRQSYVAASFANAPAEALVTGSSARGIDDTAVITSYTLSVMAFVLGLSFVILLVVFRSIVVPAKAMVMNLLSVGAAYGLMVLVFQHGIGNELFGFQQVERIETWVPLFMFAILFGLSMDYHVFLLTRIKERFDQSGDNAESVAYGVRSTASVITGAALIMVAVFSGFAAGDLTMFQQLGFGLAVAIFLDATIVRIVLVPASMALLGDRNWYLPRWLEWLPTVEVEATDHKFSEQDAALPASA